MVISKDPPEVGSTRHLTGELCWSKGKKVSERMLFFFNLTVEILLLQNRFSIGVDELGVGLL